MVRGVASRRLFTMSLCIVALIMCSIRGSATRHWAAACNYLFCSHSSNTDTLPRWPHHLTLGEADGSAQTPLPLARTIHTWAPKYALHKACTTRDFFKTSACPTPTCNAVKNFTRSNSAPQDHHVSLQVLRCGLLCSDTMLGTSPCLLTRRSNMAS